MSRVSHGVIFQLLSVGATSLSPRPPVFVVAMPKHSKPRRDTDSKGLMYARIKARIERELQLSVAAKWCQENDKGYRAAYTAGLLPDKKARWTLKQILDPNHKRTINLKPHHASCILTGDEEHQLVEFCERMAEAGWPLDREDISQLVIGALRLRVANNASAAGAGRHYRKLSVAAKRALEVRAGLPCCVCAMRWVLVPRGVGDRTRSTGPGACVRRRPRVALLCG